jgi:IMP and pyridine-specific 5'-nucleotidase
VVLSETSNANYVSRHTAEISLYVCTLACLLTRRAVTNFFTRLNGSRYFLLCVLEAYDLTSSKGLLAVPFVLHSQPTAVFEPEGQSVEKQASVAQQRYAEIFRDVENIINDHSKLHNPRNSFPSVLSDCHETVEHQKAGKPERSKLKLLVPSVANFFTPLALHDAFIWQDRRRCISFRRFVPPSFNDVRLVLNTAQIMSLVRSGPLDLVTFDGDVTLYDDGMCLTRDNPVIGKILRLMKRGSKIGIVTAAGYTEAHRYYERLFGLLHAIQNEDLPLQAKENLIILGGESNYCFKFDANSPDLLRLVPREEWLLKEMLLWTESDITELLDIAEASLRDTVRNMRMTATIVRKERAVGIIPADGQKFCRETLEETVLIVQKILVPVANRTIPLQRTDISRKCRMSDSDFHSALSTVLA